MEELERTGQSIKERIGNLKSEIVSGRTQRFSQASAYKLIGPLARFHHDYRAVNEIIMNGTTLEVSSSVNFKSVKATGTFNTHPAYIDAFTQAGGFVMNCNDANDLEVEVFVNHGWDSLQLYEQFSVDENYNTYVQMIEKEGRMFEGDVVVLRGDKIAASYKGVVVSLMWHFVFLSHALTRFIASRRPTQASTLYTLSGGREKAYPTGGKSSTSAERYLPRASHYAKIYSTSSGELYSQVCFANHRRRKWCCGRRFDRRLFLCRHWN